MSWSFEKATTSVLMLAAIAVAGAAVHRELRPRAEVRRFTVDPSGPPSYVAGWEEWIKDGILVGRADAPLKIVEFADFECPFCRRFHSSYVSAKQHFGDDVALVFIHYPLRRHRFALPAARAADCAHAQGRFADYHDRLFEKQDSLGLKSWISYAVEAGVRDTAAFAACAAGSDPMKRVDAGLALAEKLGVGGTPTILVNGWRFPLTPYDSLTQVLARVRAQESPFDRPSR